MPRELVALLKFQLENYIPYNQRVQPFTQLKLITKHGDIPQPVTDPAEAQKKLGELEQWIPAEKGSTAYSYMTWRAAESVLQLTDKPLSTEQISAIASLQMGLSSDDPELIASSLEVFRKLPNLRIQIDTKSDDFQTNLQHLCGIRTRSEYEHMLDRARTKLSAARHNLTRANNRPRKNVRVIERLETKVQARTNDLNAITTPNAKNVVNSMHKRYQNLLKYYTRLAEKDPFKFNQTVRNIKDKAFKSHDKNIREDSGLASRLDHAFFTVTMYGFHPSGQGLPLFLAPLLTESPLLPDWADKGFAITFMKVSDDGIVTGLYDAASPDSASTGPQIKATNQTSPDKVLKKLNANWVNIINAVRSIIQNPELNTHGMSLLPNGIIIAEDGTPVAKILHDSNNTNRIAWSQVRQIILNADAINDPSLIDQTITQKIIGKTFDGADIKVPSHYWLTQSHIDILQNVGCPSPDHPGQTVAVINDFAAKTVASVDTLGAYIIRHRANQLLVGQNRLLNDDEVAIIEGTKRIPDAVAERLSNEQYNILLLAIGIALTRTVNGPNLTYQGIVPPLLIEKAE